MPRFKTEQALNPGLSGFKVPTLMATGKLFSARRGRNLGYFHSFPTANILDATLFPLCELSKVLTPPPTPSCIPFSVASDPQERSTRPLGRSQLTLTGS